MNKFAKFLLVSTSFAPILFTYAFVMLINNCSFISIVPFLVIGVSLVIICFLLLHYAGNNFERESFEITSISTADGEVLGFMIAYLLPLLSLMNPSIDWKVITFIGVLFFVVIWTTNSYHINPLINFGGYHFYEVTEANNVTYLLLTKKELRKTSNVNTVVHLTEYMIMDVEE